MERDCFIYKKNIRIEKKLKNKTEKKKENT